MQDPQQQTAPGKVLSVTENYYDSSDANTFYNEVWSNGEWEDIHVGFYENESEPISVASRRTVKKLVSLLESMILNVDGITENCHGLDIGSGYGGPARFLAREYGCKMTCLNLSTVENAKAAELAEAEKLQDKVKILHGDMSQIPLPDNSVDFVWTQDAMDHSPSKALVMKEVSRVLKPGGVFIMTDLMEADGGNLPDEQRKIILGRIKLPSLGSIGFYTQELAKHGVYRTAWRPLPQIAAHHYSNVKKALIKRQGELTARKMISEDFVEGMKAGLDAWIRGFQEENLMWGFAAFCKPPSKI